MKLFFCIRFYIPLAAFTAAFLFLPISMLDGLNKMPGDIGDARLNNYFLEHFFQFVIGKADSLWNLPFFFPFPYVLGFSDNLFGSAPVYFVARLLGGETDTAFQVWFLFGYAANFTAAYYALRRLKGSVLAATVGALIFAFALPTTAHAGHAQLHYRFGLPLAIVFFTDFLNLKVWRYLLIAGAWVVWQFYAGVYIGFFTLFLMATMSFAYLASTMVSSKASLRNIGAEMFSSWRSQTIDQKRIHVGGFILLLLLLLFLFYPYLQVSRLYGAKRSWDEIAVMLPRPQSYFLADASTLWSQPGAKVFANIPMRHEHQMFIGLVPLMLGLAGFILGSRAKNGQTFTLMYGMLGIAIVLTIYVGGFSLWYLLHKLPLASAIRAMSRLDQAFLFPAAYLSVIAIDNIRERFALGTKAIFVIILPLLIFEAGRTSMSTSTKESWRGRLSSLTAEIPDDLPRSGIVFFSQHTGPAFADELDAMWVSLKKNIVTMNGYSGLYPPGYQYEYGNDCAALPKRVLSYLNFINQSKNTDLYRDLISRIAPVGFINCDSSWLITPPSISFTDRIFTESDFTNLKYSSGKLLKTNNQHVIRLSIHNSSNSSLAAVSTIGNPIRISWRSIAMDGQPMSGWDTRKDLPFDVPPQGELEVYIKLHPSEISNAKEIQISLVQEGIFWAHDIGLEPLTIPLN